MKFCVMCLFAILALRCGPAPVESVPLSQEFDLKVGHQTMVHGEDLFITFSRLAEEGRCPEGVLCLWEGNARIQIRAEKGGVGITEAPLNTTLDPKHILFAGYDITMKKLSPYPKYGQPVDTLAYVATLLVTK